jgi:hypothetical protein
MNLAGVAFRVERPHLTQAIALWVEHMLAKLPGTIVITFARRGQKRPRVLIR